MPNEKVNKYVCNKIDLCEVLAFKLNFNDFLTLFVQGGGVIYDPPLVFFYPHFSCVRARDLKFYDFLNNIKQIW